MRVLATVFVGLALVVSCRSALAASDPVIEALADDAAAVAAAPSPGEQQRAVVDALIANDIEALGIQLSGKSQEELAQQWERGRIRAAESEYSSPADYVIGRYWSMLETPAGTAELSAEVYPAFVAQANSAVAEFNDDFAKELSKLASSDDFSPDEVQQLSQLALAAQRWANGIDWQDRERFDRALDAIAGFVRGSGTRTASEIELLPYEEALALGDNAIATVKRVLAAYDLDVDATLRTIQVDELSRNGDESTVRWSARVLDIPIAIVQEMRYDREYGQQWITAKRFEDMANWREQWEAEERAEAARDAAPSSPAEPQHAGDTGSCSPSVGNADAENQWWADDKKGEEAAESP